MRNCFRFILKLLSLCQLNSRTLKIGRSMGKCHKTASVAILTVNETTLWFWRLDISWCTSHQIPYFQLHITCLTYLYLPQFPFPRPVLGMTRAKTTISIPKSFSSILALLLFNFLCLSQLLVFTSELVDVLTASPLLSKWASQSSAHNGWWWLLQGISQIIYHKIKHITSISESDIIG